MPRRVAPVAVLVALAAGAGLADAKPKRPDAAASGPSLTAEPQATAPGDTLVLRGRGFPRNAQIELLAGPPGGDAQRIGGAQTGRRGVFTARIRIRPRSDAGRFVALACHDACRVKASARFSILAP